MSDNVEALVRQLYGPTRSRERAAKALHLLGPQAADAIPHLCRLLRDAYDSVRHAAAYALATIDRRGDGVPSLEDALLSANPLVRLSAAEALVEADCQAGDAVRAIIGVMRDEAKGCRVEAANILRRLGARAAAVVPEEEWRMEMESIESAPPAAPPQPAACRGTSMNESQVVNPRQTSMTRAVKPRSSMGSYRLLRCLGEGGMGTVYLACKEGEGFEVAVKVLNDRLASNQTYIDRFYSEAKSGKLLNHPNIVRTLDRGQDERTGHHYLVMEYVDGPSTHTLLEQLGRLPVGEVVQIGLDVARALEHAHSRNVIHRDIKPSNILKAKSGGTKLADLGLAKDFSDRSRLSTAPGAVLGTSAYMPFEQEISAKRADHRSDIFALGATLYVLLTGRAPFVEDADLDVVEKKRDGLFVPARSLNEAVPAILDLILAKMMAGHPRDRYQTASEVSVDLERTGLSAGIGGAITLPG